MSATQQILDCEDNLKNWNSQRIALERWLNNELNQLNVLNNNGLSLIENKMSTFHSDINAFNERRLKKTSEFATFYLKTQQMCAHVESIFLKTINV